MKSLIITDQSESDHCSGFTYSHTVEFQSLHKFMVEEMKIDEWDIQHDLNFSVSRCGGGAYIYLFNSPA